MSVVVKIGQDERSLDSADQHWVTNEIVSRRKDGNSVIVQVVFKTGDLDFTLSTPTGSRGKGSRNATAREQPIVDLWNELRLIEDSFSPGNVVAFLQRVRKFI